MTTKSIILLLKKYFIESWRRDLVFFTIVFLFNALCSIFNEPFYTFFLVSLISIYAAGTSFSALSNTHQGISLLVIPTNTFDKLFSTCLINHIYIIFILLIGSILGTLLGTFVQSFYNTSDYSLSHIINLPNIFNYLLLIFIQAIFIFGSIYFRKSAILKTISWSLILGSALFFVFVTTIVIGLFKLHGPYIDNYSTFDSVRVANMSYIKKDVFLYLFFGLGIVTFWVLSFFRLRETEI